MKLILTRHGETEMNVKGLVYGNNPSPLTPQGHEQIKELGLKLKDYKIDEVFSSDIERCKLTTEGIMVHHAGVMITYTPLLREMGQDGILGKVVKDVDWDNLPESVETPQHMAQRATQILNEILSMDVETILVVSHRRYLNTFINVCLGQDPAYSDSSQLKNNSSFTLLDISEIGKGSIVSINEKP